MDATSQVLTLLAAAGIALLLMTSCSTLKVGLQTPYGSAAYDGQALTIRPAPILRRS